MLVHIWSLLVDGVATTVVCRINDHLEAEVVGWGHNCCPCGGYCLISWNLLHLSTFTEHTGFGKFESFTYQDLSSLLSFFLACVYNFAFHFHLIFLHRPAVLMISDFLSLCFSFLLLSDLYGCLGIVRHGQLSVKRCITGCCKYNYIGIYRSFNYLQPELLSETLV